MKNYTWTIKNLQTVDEGSETDFVTTVIYNVTCTEIVDEQTYSASLLSSMIFTPTIEEGFVAYTDLTESQVVGWVKDELGEKEVSSIQSSLAQQVDNKINPPVVPVNKALPW